MRRQIFCVTCDVEMIFPACSGFQENLFRKTICSACGHDARLHSKEAIEDLVNSYAKDVKLDYAEEDTVEAYVESYVESDVEGFLGPEISSDDSGVIHVDGLEDSVRGGTGFAVTQDEAFVWDDSALDNLVSVLSSQSNDISGIGGVPPAVAVDVKPPPVPPKPKVRMNRRSQQLHGRESFSDSESDPPLLVGSAPATTAGPMDSNCPRCGKPTENFSAKGMALPCKMCPKPPAPQIRGSKRESRHLQSASAVPSFQAAPTSPNSQSEFPMSDIKGHANACPRCSNGFPSKDELVAHLRHGCSGGAKVSMDRRSVSNACPTCRSAFPSKEALLSHIAENSCVAAVRMGPDGQPKIPSKARPAAPTQMVHPKPLIVIPKGFKAEWGVSSLPEGQKPTIVDDDRYAPYYAHYFGNGKRPHNLYFGRIPSSDNDPVVLAVEIPVDDPDIDPEMMSPTLRGLLFTCKPLSKKAEDRWVFFTRDTPVKDQLEGIHSALQDVKWSQAADEAALGVAMLEYEKKILSNTDRFKFGVLYMKQDQAKDEDAMFSNTGFQTEAFDHFLNFLGDRIELKGWEKYRGGLNVKDDSTGTHSVYTVIRGLEIMFHVSTLLPHDEADAQRLQKKRHLGNDVVLIVFCDSEDVMFDPQEIHSQFNHVFIVVVPLAELSPAGKRQYRVALARKPGVPVIEPFFKYPAIFEETESFREVFLTKCINSERLAMYAPDFVRKVYRTRKEMMNLTLEGVEAKKKESVLSRAMHSAQEAAASATPAARRLFAKKDRTSKPTQEDLSGGSSESTSPRPAGEASKSASLRAPSPRSSSEQHKRNRSIASFMGSITKKKDSPDGTRPASHNGPAPRKSNASDEL